jgi:uncharacterized membrane protein
MLSGYIESIANKVSDNGTIVGEAATAAGQTAAVRWNPDGSAIILATLPGNPGFPGGTAAAINLRGTIVGAITGVTASGSLQSIAIRWGRDGSVTGLPALPGAATTVATGITDEGLIVGYSGSAPDQIHAVAWRGDVVTAGLRAAPSAAVPARPGSHQGLPAPAHILRALWPTALMPAG